MDWTWAVVSGASAIVGGFVGGWTVAFRIGQWRQRVDDRLDQHDARLDSGKARVDQVPLLDSRLDTLIEELRGMRKEIREDLQRVVTRTECDRRHGDGV